MKPEIVVLIVALVASAGCAITARTVGSHDPTIDTVAALTRAVETQAEALVQILAAREAASPTPTPVPTRFVCLGADGVEIVPCEVPR